MGKKETREQSIINLEKGMDDVLKANNGIRDGLKDIKLSPKLRAFTVRDVEDFTISIGRGPIESDKEELVRLKNDAVRCVALDHEMNLGYFPTELRLAERWRAVGELYAKDHDDPHVPPLYEGLANDALAYVLSNDPTPNDESKDSQFLTRYVGKTREAYLVLEDMHSLGQKAT